PTRSSWRRRLRHQRLSPNSKLMAAATPPSAPLSQLEAHWHLDRERAARGGREAAGAVDRGERAAREHAAVAAGGARARDAAVGVDAQLDQHGALEAAPARER